jgi:hypothetical protein
MASSDSGSSDTDNLTNAPAPVIRVTLHGSGGQAPRAGDTVTLFANGVSLVSAKLGAQDISAGYIDLASADLLDGGSTLTAQVRDVAGNLSTMGAALTIDVDRAAPDTPTVQQSTVFTGTPVIAGSAPVVAGERLSVLVNDVTYVEGDGALVRSGGTWVLTIPAANALPLGVHSITAILTDAAGNARSDNSSNELLVSSVPPSVVPAEPLPFPAPAPAPALVVDPGTPPPAPEAGPGIPADVPLPLVRSIGDEISRPIASQPVRLIVDDAAAIRFASNDVAAILTARGDSAFQVVVIASGDPALLLYRGVRDQSFDLMNDMTIKFRIPADAFMHTDVNATVKLVATLSTGEPLPTWLRFDATTGQFEGTAPADANGELIISIKALDNDGRHAETIFRIKLTGNKVTGRQGLAEQLRLASKRSNGLIPVPRKIA